MKIVSSFSVLRFEKKNLITWKFEKLNDITMIIKIKEEKIRIIEK